MTSKFGGALSRLRETKPQPPEDQDAGIPENLNSGKPELTLEATYQSREKYSTYIDGELVTRLKLYAVRHRLKHREVVEAALRHYLDQMEH
ncbi:hypothetical protein [Deinococcus sp.]|uniref:hypothetical protein n=1 Tax=Deinococcus sp. TaxID=47478 RepID=UPI003B5CE90B